MRTCSTSSPAGGNSPGSGATGSKVPLVEADAFIVGIEAALNNHDWRTLTAFTEDGGVNYFGHRYTSNAYISRDMENDARTYSWSHATYYPETFTHEVSKRIFATLEWADDLRFNQRLFRGTGTLWAFTPGTDPRGRLLCAWPTGRQGRVDLSPASLQEFFNSMNSK